MEKLSNIRAFKRHARPIVAGVILGITVIWAQSAMAAPLQPSENITKQSRTCAAAIATQERRQGIPTGLLKAISHAESGRWNAENGEIIAWPWTVMTGGKGHFLPNRAAAISFVKARQAEGVENIDVGCMQINLKYHPDAFTSLDQAFNPNANAAYAANFLRERFAVKKSWILAAGDYHSTTVTLNMAYRQKITKLWNGTRSTPASTPQLVAAISIAPLDVDRTKLFNKAFSARRSGGIISGSGQVIANRLNALKFSTNAGSSLGNNFAAKRQSQLLAWRQNNGLAPTQPTITIP